MVNQVIVVGKIKELNKDKKDIISLLISVPQPFKNVNGEYEEDLVDCELNGHIATATNDYCKINDVVGIRGRLKSIYNEKYNSRTLKIVVEKLTFLSSSKNE